MSFIKGRGFVEDAAAGGAAARPYLSGPNHGMWAFRSKLDRDQSAALLFISDSTGSPSDAWIRLFANDLVTRYPDHRVEYRQCDSAGATVPTNLTVLQAGTERQHWHVPVGVSLNVPFLPYTSWRTPLTTRYVGIEVEVAPTSDAALNGSGYPTAGVEVGGCKGTNNGIWMTITQFGQISINYWDGTGLITQNNQGGTAIPAMVVGTYVRYRALIDTQNGGTRLAQFAYSTNQGQTWTAVGANQTPAQTASPNITATDSTTATSLGRVNSGNASDGFKYSHMQIFTGSSYEPVLPARIDAYHLVAGATSATALLQGSPVLQIDNIAVDGAGIGTSDWFSTTLPSRAYAYLIDKNYDSVIISSSHNDPALNASAWALRMDALRTLVSGRCPVPPPFLHVAQNPETEDYEVTDIRTQHNNRQADIIGYAARKGSPAFDAYQAFLDDGRPIRGTLVREFTIAPTKDGVHPTPAGYRLWADKFMDSVFLDGTDETV